MKRFLINVDIGERGADHPVDREVMRYVDIANVACGGHAGDPRSVGAFRALADEHHVTVAAHLSYPDRQNFGRLSVKLPGARLQAALDNQLAMLPGVHRVKFHGALYNDACADALLAAQLTAWLVRRQIREMIAPGDSELARACRDADIRVLSEAFAERRYVVDPATGRLALMSRSHAGACLEDCGNALEQVRRIAVSGQVAAAVEDGSANPPVRLVAIAADTICLHSDTPIVLDLAKECARIYGRLSGTRASA